MIVNLITAKNIVGIIISLELISIINVKCSGSGCFPCVVRDCQDVQYFNFKDSGVYHVIPDGTVTGYDVYCDMVTDGGGWTVFQRRQDGSVDFFRNWYDYEIGFGDKAGEHWLGNSALHEITSQGFYELRIDFEDWEGNKTFAQYKTFHISGMKELYNLTVSGYSGNAGDSLQYHNGQVFSTIDKSHAMDGIDQSCPKRYKGAWWYKKCHTSNLNGLYLPTILNATNVNKGIIWNEWRGGYSLKKTEMKIRRK